MQRKTKQETKKSGQKKYHNHQPLWTQDLLSTNKVDPPPGIESSMKSPGRRQQPGKPTSQKAQPSSALPAHLHSPPRTPPPAPSPSQFQIPASISAGSRKPVQPVTHPSYPSTFSIIQHASPIPANHEAGDHNLQSKPRPGSSPDHGPVPGPAPNTLPPCRLLVKPGVGQCPSRGLGNSPMHHHTRSPCPKPLTGRMEMPNAKTHCPIPSPSFSSAPSDAV